MARRNSIIYSCSLAIKFNVQGNNNKAIKALQAEPVKSDPDSFGIQVSFQDIMDALDQGNTIVDASIKAIYVELLQGEKFILVRT
jgi:hypothetical protein